MMHADLQSDPAANLLGDAAQTQVERALTELRAGRPVIAADVAGEVLVIGVEGLDEARVAGLERLAAGRARLVLPAARLRRLGLRERSEPGTVPLAQIALERIATLSLDIEARIDAPVAPSAPLDETALELLALALVLPAAVVVPVAAGHEATRRLVRVTRDEVKSFRHTTATRMEIVSRAPVPLEYAKHTEFVVFRGGEGLRDQVAVVVGPPDPAAPVPVRLHSACLTGDLFGSLKCDCGDQLRDTVRYMAENGGGVLLYLDQEGRGNGIANKIKAYRLQSQGFDTYDADEVLGFDIDQRRFGFAAEMLKQLGYTRVMAMTNNPEKLAALRAAGLDVVAERRVIGRPTRENARYLASKRDRAGHFIDPDAFGVAFRKAD